MAKKRKDGSEVPHVSSSIKSAASMWGLSITEIKKAKSSGCNAFVGSRIYRQELEKWLGLNPPKRLPVGAPIEDADTDELDRLKLIRQVKKLDIGIKSERHKLETTRELYISKDAVTQAWAKYMVMAMGEAEALLSPDVFKIFETRVRAQVKW